MAETYAEPTTRTPLHFDVLPPIQQASPVTTTTPTRQPFNIQQNAPGQLARPIDYHAQPQYTPNIQQQIIDDGANWKTIDVKPNNNTASPNTRFQDPTLPMGVSPLDIDGTDAFGKALLGFGDQISSQNTLQANNYQTREDQRKYVFTPLENFSYDVGRRTADGVQDFTESTKQKLEDLWEHRPKFEIPEIQIPKFDMPGLPDFEIPKIPEFNPPGLPNFEIPRIPDLNPFTKPQEKPIPGQPKPTVPEPQPQPQPEPKEKDIPKTRKDKRIYPEPKPFPGSQRFKIPVLCDCDALISFGLTVIDIDRGKLITAPGMGYMHYVADGGSTPAGVIEYGRNFSADSTDRFSLVSAIGWIPGSGPVLSVICTSIPVAASQQGKGYVDLIMPQLNGQFGNWGYIATFCLGCNPREHLEDPPPPPPEDCDCAMTCCPEIDYRKIQKIIEEEVKKLDVTAAVPLFWQVRHEGDKPQMVIQCAERKSAASGNEAAKYASAMYPITIPHWKGGQNDKPHLPPYKKGNWEGILVLADNSKVTINAQNEAECIKILNAIKPWIDSKMLEDSYFKGGKIKPKVPIKETQVYPRYGRYFANGQKNNKPDWRVDFS